MKDEIDLDISQEEEDKIERLQTVGRATEILSSSLDHEEKGDIHVKLLTDRVEEGDEFYLARDVEQLMLYLDFKEVDEIEPSQMSTVAKVHKVAGSVHSTEDLHSILEDESRVQAGDHLVTLDDAMAKSQGLYKKGIVQGRESKREELQDLIRDRINELKDTEAETNEQHNVRAAKINALENMLEKV